MSSRSVRIGLWGVAVALGLVSTSSAWAGAPILGFDDAVSKPGDFTPIPLTYTNTKIPRIGQKSIEAPAPWPRATLTTTKEVTKPACEACPKEAAPPVVVEKAMPAADAVTVVPPPGTLGYTYRRYSAPIPCDRHPRTGMLDVKGAPADAVLTVEGMRGYPMECGVWRFESLPLFPGTPHIYRVVARRWCDGRYVAEVRTLRLIPGRIVNLDF